MPEIDLITHAATRELRAFTRSTGQPTHLDLLDLAPMAHVHKIEITEEIVTITYGRTVTHRYNANEVTQREWSYKYNDDPAFTAAVAAVIERAREHLRDLPENVACPPGCAQCCSGYEPFVTRADVQRIADHFGIGYDETMARYVVARDSADGHSVGYLRKIEDDLAAQCVFLMGEESGRHYCGIYAARPHDCGAFTPIGCGDVDMLLPRKSAFTPAEPFEHRSINRVKRKARR